MAKERAVVVGAGGISQTWFPPLLQEKVEIVGVVDKFPAAAQKAIQKL
jgi:predicted dehydrogenase